MIPLFVTVDTEGDNGWDRPKKIETTNANGVNRFQALCEKYGIKPVYLTTYEMAQNDVLVSSLKQKNHAGLCEVGMHMHAWSTPPVYDLTGDDLQNLPFITEYPEDIIYNKVENLTRFLNDRFEEEMISHRSGRWIVNNEYLQVLVNNGYKVDCSHTPFIDWACSIGDPNGKGGSDYSKSPRKPNYIELDCGRILEIPMTTMKNKAYDNTIVDSFVKCGSRIKRLNRVCNALNGRKIMMLRPDVRREHLQLNMINKLKTDTQIEHVELMIHSSEVYRGTSPHCKTDEDIDKLYGIMEKMFAELCSFCKPMSFREYISEI